MNLVAKHKVVVRDVINKAQFNQNLIFSCVHIAEQEQAIKLIVKLIEMGVEPN